ncbi:hypothetical protein RHGRI_020229 [Rhododendron griersonianum]|uniref:Uncharacterized protein n=1 Tax=Rhododendron griersonianum TaxID=479676 RepID=A0AAV6JHM0_9ERIC|nr:hypothetical protein RHGRI_020229 [Rhododendron griersonianum]
MPNLEHDVFDFQLNALLILLGLHYRGNGIVSPFQARPITMGIASASLLLYCISYELELRFTRVGRGGMGLCRSILIVSLASLLFRNPVWFVMYFSYVLFANREMMCYVTEVLRSWVYQRMVLLLYRAICWINWRWFVAPVHANRGNILPLSTSSTYMTFRSDRDFVCKSLCLLGFQTVAIFMQTGGPDKSVDAISDTVRDSLHKTS